MTTTFTPDTNGLRNLSELPTEPALRQAAAFLADLVKDPAFLTSQVLPLIEEAKYSEPGRRLRDLQYARRRHEADQPHR